MSTVIHSYKDLIVWQKAIDLVCAIYELTEKFPSEERFALTDQMRRAAVSIPSNIAEGRRRGTRKDFHYFLRIASASGAELETQVMIAKRLKKTCQLDFSKVDSLLDEVMRMLTVMTSKLGRPQLIS